MLDRIHRLPDKMLLSEAAALINCRLAKEHFVGFEFQQRMR